jgi:hypothetical protein
MAVFLSKIAITGGALSKQIVHNLGSVSAVLVACKPTWDSRTPITAQDTNSITVTFSAQCPGAGGTLHVKVEV